MLVKSQRRNGQEARVEMSQGGAKGDKDYRNLEEGLMQ